MIQQEKISKTLKNIIKSKGFNYKNIAERLELSEASVKRLFSHNKFTLDQLVLICEVLNIELYELCRLALTNKTDGNQLTLSQEQFLVDNPKYFITFYLLLNKWALDDIQIEYKLSLPELVHHLTQLDKQKIIELLPGNHVKLCVERPIRWIKKGPILEKYASMVKSEFINSDFSQDGTLYFEAGELSPHSAALIKNEIEQFSKKIQKYIDADMTATFSKKVSYGFMVGFRPWVFSLLAVEKLKKK